MGEEGFSSDSSLLYHVNIPSAVVDVRPWELPDLTMTPNHPLTPRHFSTHALFPDDASADQVDAVTGRRLLMGNGDVRLSYVVATAPSPTTATPSATSASTSRPAGPWSRPCSATSPSARATTRSSRAPRRSASCRGTRADLRDRGELPHRPAKRFASDSCSSTRRTASATCAARPARRWSRRTRTTRRPRTSRCSSSTVAPARVASPGRSTPAAPPVRRGRLGRVSLPLRLQHRGLRADHRARAPAAAGAPGLRGPQLRHLQLRAPQGRLPPRSRSRCRTTTPTWTPTR